MRLINEFNRVCDRTGFCMWILYLYTSNEHKDTKLKNTILLMLNQVPRYKPNKTSTGVICCKLYNMMKGIKEYLNKWRDPMFMD